MSNSFRLRNVDVIEMMNIKYFLSPFSSIDSILKYLYPRMIMIICFFTTAGLKKEDFVRQKYEGVQRSTKEVHFFDFNIYPEREQKYSVIKKC